MTRNLVKRRLRSIVAPRLSTLPDGASVVVRALPPAARAPFAELKSDVDAAIDSSARKAFA